MKIKSLLQGLGAVLALGLMQSALAITATASIGMTPSLQTVAPSDTVSFTINVDFSQISTSGGAFDITYDSSILTFDSFTFDSTFLANAGVSAVNPTLSAGLVQGLGFDAVNGYAGSQAMGVISFTALQPGTSSLHMADTVGYEFLDTTTNFNQIPVSYTDGAVQVSAVPLPAAVWLFGSGLLGLAGIVRRRAR